MSDTGGKGTERERGIFTSEDEDWLRGDSDNPTDQKRRCRQGLQLAIEDIKELIETEPGRVDNFDGVGELFNDVEENTELDRVECAEKLIALAFIITNDSIDYTELLERINWHPRTASETPREVDRNTGARPPTYDISELLRFRAALSNGVNLGQEYVGKPQEADSAVPLFKTNTKLYKEPTVDRINPDDNRLNHEVLKDIYAGLLDTTVSVDAITENLSVDSTEFRESLTAEQMEDRNLLKRFLENTQTREDAEDEIPVREDAAGYIARDIKLMVNRRIVRRHQMLGHGSEFSYEFADSKGETPGPIIPQTLGRRVEQSENGEQE